MVYLSISGAAWFFRVPQDDIEDAIETGDLPANDMGIEFRAAAAWAKDWKITKPIDGREQWRRLKRNATRCQTSTNTA